MLFHHVLGLTDGVRGFASRLSAQGHEVHTPDLYEGRLATSFEEGFAIKNDLGAEHLQTLAEEALDEASTDADSLVLAGISLGVTHAQRLAQTRAGIHGALLYAACLPISGEWAVGPWPETVRVQVHGMDDDEFFAHEGDIDAARELVAAAGPELAELFTYPGDGHLFMDSSLPSYDSTATDAVLRRSLDLLDAVST
ncbi:dienelactone hydrolase family protein [Euzebya tangerina]|uniref:dienelactone hydrolase family protein n=1 Tax=Euzebya tangerina TaxID=591198 RepID=UPI000E3228EC|nr:dienelactone hydrolase family protein [Euzebya tangerina]